VARGLHPAHRPGDREFEVAKCLRLDWGVTTATSSPATIALVRAVRRLAESVATPLLPADYLDLVAPLRATAQLRGRVVSVTPETRHAATVEIRPGRSWKGHRPGQYIRIGIDVDGVRHWRAYSLTSQSTEVKATVPSSARRRSTC
jgi:stearoyl-CoA 9-desaturase NADPH oxidoreductase